MGLISYFKEDAVEFYLILLSVLIIIVATIIFVPYENTSLAILSGEKENNVVEFPTQFGEFKEKPPIIPDPPNLITKQINAG